jgi:hypothetical protein
LAGFGFLEPAVPNPILLLRIPWHFVSKRSSDPRHINARVRLSVLAVSGQRVLPPEKDKASFVARTNERIRNSRQNDGQSDREWISRVFEHLDI